MNGQLQRKLNTFFDIHMIILNAGSMAVQLLQNMASGHVKVKKGTGHVFYMATPSHATESVSSCASIFLLQRSCCCMLSYFLIRAPSQSLSVPP